MVNSTNPWVIDGQEVKFAYFDNVTFAYYIAGETDKEVDVYFAFSVCNTKKDTFDKSLGRKIAFGRLAKGGFTENGDQRIFQTYVEKKENRVEQNLEILKTFESALEAV